MSAGAGLAHGRGSALGRDCVTTILVPPAVTARERLLLVLILLAALAARVAALLAFDEPPWSDGAAYLEMARTLLAGTGMRDPAGDAAFFAPGYPLLLAPAFALFGSDPAVARGVNLLLGLAAVALTWALGRRATGRPAAGLLAALALALLIPAAAATERLEREHLATPLLLLFLWLALAAIRARRPALAAALAGLAFGAGLLAGGSTLLAGLALPAALALRRPPPRAAAAALFAFAGATLLVLAPWLVRNERVVGRAVLTTSAGMNLYLGNNLYADGSFVSIADTPLGASWRTVRALYDEPRRSDVLAGLAATDMRARPVRTAVLDVHKLVRFWLPELPDPDDDDAGTALAIARWAAAAQHVLIVAFAGVAIFAWRRWPTALRPIALALAAFWLAHVVGYVVPRDRAPAMPLLLILAALPIAEVRARRAPLAARNAS